MHIIIHSTQERIYTACYFYNTYLAPSPFSHNVWQYSHLRHHPFLWCPTPTAAAAEDVTDIADTDTAVAADLETAVAIDGASAVFANATVAVPAEPPQFASPTRRPKKPPSRRKLRASPPPSRQKVAYAECRFSGICVRICLRRIRGRRGRCSSGNAAGTPLPGQLRKRGRRCHPLAHSTAPFTDAGCHPICALMLVSSSPRLSVAARRG